MSEEHIAYATKYGEPIDCTWIITADPGSQIFIQFAEFELAMPNDCNFNYIQVGSASLFSSTCFSFSTEKQTLRVKSSRFVAR